MFLVRFLDTVAGRLIRAAAGVALILGGLFAVGGTLGIVLAVVGLVPLGAGIFDVCVMAPLIGLPFSGARLRDKVDGAATGARLGAGR